MLKLYNSLTRKKEEFSPIKTGEVGIYSCGPTVYDQVHIGNLRAYVFTDLLQKTLRELEEYKVRWVMNITDIDDRMIDRIRTKSADKNPKVALSDLADKYDSLFLMDLRKLNIDPADLAKMPHATDYIGQMQALTSELVAQDIAYVSNGSVYFSISNYKKSGQKYGVLSKVDFAAEARLTDDQDQKEGAADFALWKARRHGEPYWDFEVNGDNLAGRPGWHIECSAMSTAELGDFFDIHTGGADLIFPHHENEIAQSGGKLAKFFLHNEFLLVNGAKMSKSANNFYTLADISDPLAFRYMCLAAHYRNRLDFSNASLAAATNRLENLRNFAAKLVYNTSAETDESVADFRTSFRTALEDDLNSPAALAQLASFCSKAKNNHETLEALRWADKILSLNLVPEKKDFNASEQEFLTKRAVARKSGDYELSDKIRSKLKTFGIEVEDTREQQLAWRVSK